MTTRLTLAAAAVAVAVVAGPASAQPADPACYPVDDCIEVLCLPKIVRGVDTSNCDPPPSHPPTGVDLPQLVAVAGTSLVLAALLFAAARRIP